MSEIPINWPEVLRSQGPGHGAALSRMRQILIDGLRSALRERSDVSEAHLEDFAQDALLRILDRLDQFSGRSQFTTWAHTIALNTAFTELRRKRYQDVSLDALTESGNHLNEPVADALTDNEERTQIIDALRQAVADKLSSKQRAAIVGELQGLPFDQIVELLETNRNAAYKMLHDARRALKQHLETAGITSETIRTTFAI